MQRAAAAITQTEALFVNQQHSRRIPQLSHPESTTLLRFLYRWSQQVKFTCRWKWSVGDLAIWSNVGTNHILVNDADYTRQLLRCSIIGEPPRAANTDTTWPHHRIDDRSSSGLFGILGYEF